MDNLGRHDTDDVYGSSSNWRELGDGLDPFQAQDQEDPSNNRRSMNERTGDGSGQQNIELDYNQLPSGPLQLQQSQNSLLAYSAQNPHNPHTHNLAGQLPTLDSSAPRNSAAANHPPVGLGPPLVSQNTANLHQYSFFDAARAASISQIQRNANSFPGRRTVVAEPPQNNLVSANLHQCSFLDAAIAASLSQIQPYGVVFPGTMAAPTQQADFARAAAQHISQQNHHRSNSPLLGNAMASQPQINGTGALSSTAQGVASCPSSPPVVETCGNSVGNRTGRQTPSAFVLFVEEDEAHLSSYQCLVRKQIEIFQQPWDVHKPVEKLQGRKLPVTPGQVGIRCRHCASYPNLSQKERGKYSVLFPRALLAVYQSAQNMANTHLLSTCKMIPSEVRQQLVQKRTRDKGQKTCKSAYGGGRQYWADSLQRNCGVIEDPRQNILMFSNGEE